MAGFQEDRHHNQSRNMYEINIFNTCTVNYIPTSYACIAKASQEGSHSGSKASKKPTGTGIHFVIIAYTLKVI